MTGQGEGRQTGERNVGVLPLNPTAQRFRSTLDYMDISPYNLPEHPAVNVKINPLQCGFISRFRRIIAQAGMLWPKLLCVRADRQLGAPRRCMPDD
jgi:hypothetical protein